MKTRIVSVALVLTFLSFTAFAQKAYFVDLATQEEGETSVDSVEAGESFVVVVTNRMPNTAYTVLVEKRDVPIAPLNRSAVAGEPGDCNAVVSTFKAEAIGAQNEGQVADAVRAARVAASPCNETVKETLRLAIAEFTVARELGPFKLLLGEEILVTVSRGTGEAKQEWKLKITTGPAGEWRVLYGFNFVPDNDDHYFLRESATTAGTYDIVEERKDNDLAFVPTIFASWQSRRQHAGVSWGLSGGMGFDSEKPVIFVGPTVIFRQNVSLNFGLVMQERQRLDPKLDKSKPLPALIDNDKLHTSDGYRPNWYIGIGFRFDRNPFKAEEPGENEEQEEE